jgi:ACS family hexuronate transporter-like MFS transporter
MIAGHRSLRWGVASLLFLSTGINYLDRQTLSILASTVQAELRIDDLGYATITSYFLLSYTIMYAISGGLIDFLGTRRSLAIAVSGWSIASMLLGFVNSASQLALVRFVLGGFESANYPAGAKAVAEWFPMRERALGMGILGAGGSFGAAVAAPLITYLALAFGWRSAFVVVGAIGFVWVVLWMAIYRPAASHPKLSAEDRAFLTGSDQPAVKSVPFGLKALLSNRRAWGCILIRVFTDPIVYFVSFWVPKYLTSVHGFSLADIGKYAWIPFVALSGGNILGGLVTSTLVSQGFSVNRVRKGLMLGSSILMLFSGFGVAYADSSLLAIAGITGLSLGHGLWGNIAVPAEIFPSHSVALVSGLGGTLGGVAGIVSQYGIAWASNHQAYSYIFIVFSVFPLLAFLSVKILIGNIGEISHSLAAGKPTGSSP